jgi:hypothetical protein
MDIANTIALIVLAAAVGEGINEFFFIPWLDVAKGKINETARVQLIRLWSGLVGVGIAWELQLDVFALLGADMRHGVVGQVLTGLLLGRGSNYVHELIKRFVLGNEQRELQVALKG